MRVTVTVRLMDGDRLLGWGNAQMDAGNGQLTPAVHAEIEIEEAGTTTEVVEHWADLDVQRRQTVAPQKLEVGQRLQWGPLPWAFPSAVGRLAPVTIRRSIAIGVATGGSAARS